MCPLPQQDFRSKMFDDAWIAKFLLPPEASFLDEIKAKIALSKSHQNGIDSRHFNSHCQSYLLQSIQWFIIHIMSVDWAISQLYDLLHLERQQLYSLSLDIPSELLLAHRESMVSLNFIIIIRKWFWPGQTLLINTINNINSLWICLWQSLLRNI